MTLRSRAPRRRLPKEPSAKVYQLKVTLLAVEPAVWRRILVPGHMTLDRLHTVIQKALGWTDTHLHEFLVREQRYGQPDPEEPDVGLAPEWKAALHTVAPTQGLRFEYLYDFGDQWTHEVLVERIAVEPKELRHPVCLAGERACPPEDSGGPDGYAEFLQAIRDPDHPRYTEMLEWASGDFDPEAFDLSAVNRKLSLLN